MHVAPGSLHCVPGSHVPPQPSSGASPQGRVEDGAQLGVQQLPSLHTCPPGHIVPSPQVRQTAPLASSTSASAAPQGTDAASAQAPQHTRSSSSVVPGGFVHDAPAGQREPTPAQVRQDASGIGAPQSIESALAQLSQHTPRGPPLHVCPSGHAVP